MSEESARLQSGEGGMPSQARGPALEARQCLEQQDGS